MVRARLEVTDALDSRTVPINKERFRIGRREGGVAEVLKHQVEPRQIGRPAIAAVAVPIVGAGGRGVGHDGAPYCERFASMRFAR